MASPDSPRLGCPAATELAPDPWGPEPSSRRSWIRGALEGRAPSTLMFHRRERSLPSPKFGDHVSAPPLVQGRRSSFPTSRCSWGTPFLPPRLWGRGDGVLASPRYPNVESPWASQVRVEGVPNLSFRSCTWGVSSPSYLPHVLGKGVTFPLRAFP